MQVADNFPIDVLPGASFADRYARTVEGQGLDATAAAERAFARSPAWVAWLMALRNLAVRPFGLKRGAGDLPPRLRRIGMFPLVSETPSRAVLGFDDRHLDFRIVVEVRELGEGRQEVSAATLVAPHNLFGRIYLATVMPFHKMIVPTMLARVASGGKPEPGISGRRR